MRVKIAVVGLTLTVSIVAACAQDLDNYPPRDANPDIYNTNADGTCPLTGAANPTVSTEKAKAEENKLKNRWNFPAASDFDQSVNLAAMLAPGDDHGRFDQTRAARITGYVTDCIVGGSAHRAPPQHSGESCNCGATSPLDTDSHIDVVLTPADETIATRHVIVEVTPRIRELMRRQGIDWTTDALRAQLKHHWVEFEGWLFFDPDHLTGAVNTDPDDTKQPPNWRATVWELHPVTKVTVLNGSPTPPPSTGSPSPISGQWEYQMISAADAMSLLNQTNSQGSQGWELAAVLIDTSRPDKYIGFLKRKKP